MAGGTPLCLYVYLGKCRNDPSLNYKWKGKSHSFVLSFETPAEAFGDQDLEGTGEGATRDPDQVFCNYSVAGLGVTVLQWKGLMH